MGNDQLSLWLMIRRTKLTRRRKMAVAVMVESSSCKLCLMVMNMVKFSWRKMDAKIVSLAAVVISSGWSCLAV